MSYEGYNEYLCENGHYNVVDCYYDDIKICSCNSKMKYYHSVDITNGYEENNPSTFPAEKTEIGFDDIWNKDHYGNKYAIKRMKYKPVKNWRKMQA